MSDFGSLQEAFQDQQLDRSQVVKQWIETADKSVLAVVLTAPRDSAEDDMVQVTILKELPFLASGYPLQASFAQTILDVLNDSTDDYLMRVHCA